MDFQLLDVVASNCGTGAWHTSRRLPSGGWGRLASQHPDDNIIVPLRQFPSRPQRHYIVLSIPIKTLSDSITQ